MANREQLFSGARAAVARLRIQQGERALVVSNPATREVASALRDAAAMHASEVAWCEMEDLSVDGASPPREVGQAMERADVLLLATTTSLSHTPERIRATARGARVASMPEITPEMLARALSVDYQRMGRLGSTLAALLTSASEAVLRTPLGTDLRLGLEGRAGRNDDGDLSAPGAFGNLPAGEAYIAPIESTASGTIVFDGSFASHGLLRSPLRVTVDAGRWVEAEGEGAAKLSELLCQGGPHGTSIAELGIGTNESARITGLVLEDEKVRGTVHVAFGASRGIGGVNDAAVHLDGVILNPSLWIGHRQVLDEGRFLDV